MKVLFVASGNSKNYDIVPFIKSQGESLRKQGVDVHYFPVLGKGMKGYWQSSKQLRAYLKEHQFDLIHAHYGLCGWVAALARPGIPIVQSFMGTDAYGEYIGPNKVEWRSRYLSVLAVALQPFLTQVISKSANIERFVWRKRISHIVPNGVRLEQFKIYENGCREELAMDPGKQYVLFISNTADPRKNFKLVKAAFDRLNRPNTELITPFPVPHDVVVKYFNSADVMVTASFMEGSPNVVKEAMACNCPVVVTDVGDAAWVVGDTPGCYVTPHTVEEMARKLDLALTYAAEHGRTHGRRRIEALELSAEEVAQRIIGIYQLALNQRKPLTVKHAH